jgi:hypothetical protein
MYDAYLSTFQYWISFMLVGREQWEEGENDE